MQSKFLRFDVLIQSTLVCHVFGVTKTSSQLYVTTCMALQEDELVEKERSAADTALRASDARVSVSAHTATKDSMTIILDRLQADIDK